MIETATHYSESTCMSNIFPLDESEFVKQVVLK